MTLGGIHILFVVTWAVVTGAVVTGGVVASKAFSLLSMVPLDDPSKTMMRLVLLLVLILYIILSLVGLAGLVFGIPAGGGDV